MITSVNLNNANQYTVLFDEISDNLNAAADPEAEIAQGYKDLYTELSNKEKYAAFWTVDENGNDIIKITSLETYFSIIEQLVDIKPQYGILPLDEPYYEINANTRAIKSPDNFSVQVQGDEIAETIYFKINRYFDTTDLSQQKIYIQWELPDSKKTKGYSQPWIVDIESEPGYVVFGWALTSIVTQVAGNVRFSVRFCNIDTDNTISYSLSTLTSILPIKTGLTLDFNDAEIIEDKAENRFKNGLLSGIVPASKPIISFQNFENDAYYFIVNDDDISTEDSYQLQITGISPEAGSLNYSWYKTNSTTGKAELVKEISDFIIGEYTVTKDINNIFIVNETYPLETFIKEYYCFLEKENNNEVSMLIDEVKDIADRFDADIGELTIYVPIYTYDVTEPGYYYCAITNKVGLQSEHIKSNTAYFPMPIDPTPSHSDTVREGLLSSGTRLTDSSIVQSNNQQIIDNSKYSYKWYEVVDSQEKEIEDANTQDYTVTKEGIYRCKVYSILNNANSKIVQSDWNVVQAPSLNIAINNREVMEAEELYFPIATSLEVKISNMTDYDQVYYSVKKVDRGNGSESEITAGNLLLSAGQNKFTFNSIPDKCKITCKGSVGINSIDETDEFIFYVDVGTVNT